MRGKRGEDLFSVVVGGFFEENVGHDRPINSSALRCANWDEGTIFKVSPPPVVDGSSISVLTNVLRELDVDGGKVTIVEGRVDEVRTYRQKGGTSSPDVPKSGLNPVELL